LSVTRCGRSMAIAPPPSVGEDVDTGRLGGPAARPASALGGANRPPNGREAGRKGVQLVFRCRRRCR
jgi:hypothetical protein